MEPGPLSPDCTWPAHELHVSILGPGRPGGTYIGREAEALSVGQSQQLVVIQHRVQVLNPLRVHVAIKHNPLALLQFSPHVVYDPGGRVLSSC